MTHGERVHAPVKRDPLGVWNEDETRGDKQLCKIVGQDTHLLVPLKIDPRLLQQLDRVGRVHVLAGTKKKKKVGGLVRNAAMSYAPDVKLEIELPCRDVLREIALLVCECDADLDELEEVDVAPHGLVVVV